MRLLRADDSIKVVRGDEPRCFNCFGEFRRDLSKPDVESLLEGKEISFTINGEYTVTLSYNEGARDAIPFNIALSQLDLLDINSETGEPFEFTDSGHVPSDYFEEDN